MHATTRDEDRVSGVRDDVGSPRHRRGIGRTAIEREPPEIGPASRALRCGLGEDVARQHQDNRTGATRAGGGDRHIQVVVDPGGVIE